MSNLNNVVELISVKRNSVSRNTLMSLISNQGITLSPMERVIVDTIITGGSEALINMPAKHLNAAFRIASFLQSA
jgi:hypothetical protein